MNRNRNFPVNSLAWIKVRYQANPDATRKEFFTEEQVADMIKNVHGQEDFTEADENEKRKLEICYLWRVFAFPDEDLRKKIRNAWEVAKSSN